MVDYDANLDASSDELNALLDRADSLSYNVSPDEARTLALSIAKTYSRVMQDASYALDNIKAAERSFNIAVTGANEKLRALQLGQRPVSQQNLIPWADVEFLDYEGKPTTVSPEKRVQLLREYRRTNSISQYFLARIGTPSEDPADASTWGPSVEEIDWMGFPA